MKLRAAATLGALSRRTRRWLAPGAPEAAILCYHRVFDASFNRWGLALSPEFFQEHLEYLTRHYTLLSLTRLAALLRERKAPDRSVVLTFDDGYADNLWN